MGIHIRICFNNCSSTIMKLTGPDRHLSVCLSLIRSIGRATSVEAMYEHALDALDDALGVTRASILLFDVDRVMRFKAWRGLSDHYRRAVEGHSPWTPDSPDPEPILVPDVVTESSLQAHLETINAEGIAAMAFIPLVYAGSVIGKFMLYRSEPGALNDQELLCARLVASEVAFAVARTRAEFQANRSEARLRFALDAASMGTWDWDVTAGTVRWSDNLERIHGLPVGTFDGTFDSYAREIHPDDRSRVMAAVERALGEGTAYEVEYRLVAPDGTIRWAEGKGTAERDDNGAVRMTGVCMIVTRRKEAELARLAAAEEASRLKDEFLAVLSHELRTPLNAILGWVQMLETGTLSPDRVQQAISVIGRNATLQAQLIEDMLDVSRIVTGKLDVERKPVSIAVLVDQAVGAALPAAEAKGITLTKEIACDSPYVDGDFRRLQQVMSNILSNAIRFTPEGGRVEVGCKAEGSHIEIRITDTGEGIPADFLPYVFDRFRQADSRSTRKHGGLGLGLAITRYLVDQHQGEISAESPGPGEGTTIRVRLPLRPAPVADSSSPAALEDAGPGGSLDGVTIVIVDDHRDSRELVATICERSGARVVVCENAQAALEALRAGGVDLIVADIAMPDVDGYTLVRQIRERSTTLPCIAMSAYVRDEDRTLALSAGFDAYCVKPIDTGTFLKTAQRVLRR
jgi:PAS domain S-box-containing protein